MTSDGAKDMPRSCWCSEYCTRYPGTSTFMRRRRTGITGLEVERSRGWAAARVMSQVLDVLIGRGGAIGGERSRK